MSSILIFYSHQRCGDDVLETVTILKGWPSMDSPTSCVGVMGYTIYLFQVEGRWLFDLLTQLELPRTVRPGCPGLGKLYRGSYIISSHNISLQIQTLLKNSPGGVIE